METGRCLSEVDILNWFISRPDSRQWSARDRSHELRLIWRRYNGRDADVLLVLEVQRFRDVASQAHALQQVIEKCWREEGHGQLVALEKLRLLLNNERTR